MTPNQFLVNHHLMSNRLEISQLFWFEDILVFQKIYAFGVLEISQLFWFEDILVFQKIYAFGVCHIIKKLT
jgi:hypothetical protein